MSLKAQAIKGVLWTGIQQFGTQLISFAVSILLARLLAPEEFGLVAMILVFIAISQTILDSGLSQSLIRTPDITNTDYSTVFYFNLVASLLLYGLLYLLAPFISNFYDEPTLVELVRVLGLVLVIKAFSIIQLTRLSKEMNFKLQTLILLPAILISAIVAIIMALNGYGVWSLIAYRLIKEGFSSILLWVYTKWKPDLTFSRIRFKYHFKFGINLLFSSILNSVFNNLYSLIIGKYFSAAQLGYFDRADRLQKLPVNNLGSIINKVSYPMFSKIGSDDSKLRVAYLKVIGMSIFIIAPIMIMMGILARPLVVVLLTEKWLEVVPYLQILVIAGLLYPIHSFNLNILKVKGRSDLFLRLEIIKKIITVIAVVIGINFGVIGLVWSMVFTSVASLLVNSYYSGKMIDLSLMVQLKQIFPALIMGIITGVVLYFLSRYLDLHVSDFLNLVFSTAIGLVIYLGLAHTLHEKSYVELISLIRKR